MLNFGVMATRGEKKTRSKKYDTKLAVKSTFGQLVRISVSKPKKVMAANSLSQTTTPTKKKTKE